MIRSILKISFLILAPTWFINSHAQAPAIPSGWKEVRACQITFFTPSDLKNQNARGIDSCYRDFRNSKMRLTIDSGAWGAVFTKSESVLDYKEEFIEVDAKKAQIVTYKDPGNDSKRKFVAGFYVVLFEAQNKEKEASAFLYMTVRMKSAKELEIAKQIFSSIRFDAYGPTTIEQYGPPR